MLNVCILIVSLCIDFDMRNMKIICYVLMSYIDLNYCFISFFIFFFIF